MGSLESKTARHTSGELDATTTSTSLQVFSAPSRLPLLFFFVKSSPPRLSVAPMT